MARWLPQMFYYIFALQQFKDKEVIFSVPSGNFGNIAAGMMAQQLGFPIKHFIASNNANNVVYRYLQTENYDPKETIPTISNAMDVGAPSNFVRIQKLYGSFENLKQHVSSATYTDEQTAEALLKVKNQYGYLMDTHGAVGYLGLKDYLKQTNDTQSVGIFLETAHPSKFNNVIEPIINEKIEIPARLSSLMQKTTQADELTASFEELKIWIENNL